MCEEIFNFPCCARDHGKGREDKRGDAKGVLRDSFDLAETPHTGPACTSHGYKPPATRRIDYIFVSDGFRVLRHHTHADRPDGKFPSDHDAVSALIGIK